VNVQGIEIRAVLFDLDGTLVHTRIDFDRMYREVRSVAESAGVPGTRIDGRQVLEAVDSAASWLGGEAGGDLRRRLWDVLEQIERDGSVGASLIVGADALFSHLRASEVKIGVVTRNCRSVSEALMHKFALHADVLLTRDDVAKTKPDPQHLLEALRILGTPPSKSAMLGDHWLDVQAGKDAGCAVTVGVLGERSPSWFESHPPTFIVRNLVECLCIFTRQ
jgi:phosphoglycolate phosphatase